ncbi:hypothetical protein OG203_23300 [Nocardia sp. NBC_01499]
MLFITPSCVIHPPSSARSASRFLAADVALAHKPDQRDTSVAAVG